MNNKALSLIVSIMTAVTIPLKATELSEQFNNPGKVIYCNEVQKLQLSDFECLAKGGWLQYRGDFYKPDFHKVYDALGEIRKPSCYPNLTCYDANEIFYKINISNRSLIFNFFRPIQVTYEFDEDGYDNEIWELGDGGANIQNQVLFSVPFLLIDKTPYR